MVCVAEVLPVYGDHSLVILSGFASWTKQSTYRNMINRSMTIIGTSTSKSKAGHKTVVMKSIRCLYTPS